MFFSTLRYRRAWQALIKKYDGQNVVTPSFLRQDLTLQNQKADYKFNFLSENASPGLPEQYLSRADVFQVFAARLCLIQAVDAKPGAAVSQLFPLASVFTGSTLADLETVYNGALSFRKNNIVIVEGFPSHMFREATEAQIRAESATNWPGVEKNSFRQGAGYMELGPKITMDGASTNLWNLQIPTYDGISLTTSTSGSTNKVSLQLIGFRIDQGSVGRLSAGARS